MGRPINNKFIGSGGIKVTFNGTEDGYIVRQISHNRFVVSDGTNEFVLRMAETQGEADNPPADVMFINGLSADAVASDADLLFLFTQNQFTVANGGTGYAVNDLVEVTSVSPSGAPAELRISSVSGGVVTGLATWTSGFFRNPPAGTINGSYLTIPSSSIVNSLGSGTGLSINMNFRLIAIGILDGGSTHTEGSVFQVLNTNAVGNPQLVVADSVGSNGEVLNFGIAVPEIPVTNWANVTLSTPDAIQKMVTRINSKRARLVDGTVVPWGMPGDDIPSGGIRLQYWV